MIHVAGGTYLEFCREPHWYELYGSGLRAVLALKKLGADVRYSTFCGKDQQPVLSAKSEGIQISTEDIGHTIAFSYLHPLSRPAIEPYGIVKSCRQYPKIVDVNSDKILRFGVIEGSFKVKAKMVTYDPQSPGDPRPFTENGSVADRLAVVVNKNEAKRMTGQSNPNEACLSFLKQGAEVAVIKCGTAGCIVGTAGNISRVPAYRTSRIWSIGSGDVFSSIFAYGWMELGLDAVEAATLASKGTSHYVETQLFPDNSALSKTTFTPVSRLPDEKHKKVYLAGPFFNLPQTWLVEEFKTELENAGVHVFSPLHQVGRGDADNIYEPDIAGLKASGVVLACLDGLDPGTIYEIGYAHCLGIKVIVYVSSERKEDLKMISGGGSLMTSDFASAFYLTVWAATCE